MTGKKLPLLVAAGLAAVLAFNRRLQPLRLIDLRSCLSRNQALVSSCFAGC